VPTHDGRRAPFAWFDLSAMQRIREQCPPAQTASVRNVYAALVESASRAYDPKHDGFKTTRAELAHLAAVSTKTVDRACAELVTLGLLDVQPQADEAGRSLPSVYALKSDGGDTESPPSDAAADSESPPSTRTGSEGKKEETLPTAEIARGQIRVVETVKFRGRPVKGDIVRAAMDACDDWGRRTNQTVRTFDGTGAATTSLTRVVGAMLKFPEVVELWPAMIGARLAKPWWTDGNPGVGVVFGPNVVEASIEMAQNPQAARQNGNGHGRGGQPSAEDFARIARGEA